jgi:hypothetical protein
MESKESGWTITGGPQTDAPKSEFEELQARWYKALEEGFQSKRLKVFNLKQDGRARLFYVISEESATEPLKTTIRARCIRDDLSVFDVQLTYTITQNPGPAAAAAGVAQTVTFKLLKDPKAVGVDPGQIVTLVSMIIGGRDR